MLSGAMIGKNLLLIQLILFRRNQRSMRGRHGYKLSQQRQYLITTRRAGVRKSSTPKPCSTSILIWNKTRRRSAVSPDCPPARQWIAAYPIDRSGLSEP
jgi:hypothetical protein